LPIQIQCTSVIIRNDALNRVLDGVGFEAIAPNSMSYSDNFLSQASFMSSEDAEEFARGLELRGLNRDQESPEFVVVHTHDQSVEPPCDWLILFEYERRLIATLRGNDSRTVIASANDADTDSVRHYTADEIERLFEFVERNDNIDTYRHKETGELVYHARNTETADEVFSRAFEVVWQLRREPGTPALSGNQASALKQPVADLQSLVAKYPDVAKTSLALGMAWFAMGNPDAARRQLDRAAQLDPENAVILKELGGLCLHQGDFDAAVKVAIRAVASQPEDPELLGNLAVSQLLAGDGSKAKQTVMQALKLAPGDAINRNLQNMIDDVLDGRRNHPKTLLELMTPVPKKKSLLRKWFGVGN